jgi:hypothetical protein
MFRFCIFILICCVCTSVGLLPPSDKLIAVGNNSNSNNNNVCLLINSYRRLGTACLSIFRF